MHNKLTLSDRTPSLESSTQILTVNVVSASDALLIKDHLSNTDNTGCFAEARDVPIRGKLLYHTLPVQFCWHITYALYIKCVIYVVVGARMNTKMHVQLLVTQKAKLFKATNIPH